MQVFVTSLNKNQYTDAATIVINSVINMSIKYQLFMVSGRGAVSFFSTWNRPEKGLKT